MEVQLATDGDTAALREWLRSHPERVNIPIKPGNFTLLYYVLMGLHRSDISLLQKGRPNRYDDTVRMLCEEFGADPDAPNGGEGNTAVHLAVEIDDARLLSYFVSARKAKMTPNRYGETPLECAKRRNPNGDCASILQREVDLRASYEQRAAVTEQRRREEEANLRGIRQRLDMLRVKDSDEDESDEEKTTTQRHLTPPSQYARNTHAPPQGTGPPPPLQQPLSTQQPPTAFPGGRAPSAAVAAAPPPNSRPQTAHAPRTPLGASRIGKNSGGGGGGSGTMSSSSTQGGTPLRRVSSVPPAAAIYPSAAGPAPSLSQRGIPPPAAPRRERDISQEKKFANKELEEFRATFGNGFTYVECADHFEIRGLLPYRFKGNEYFTPVVLSMYGYERQTPQLRKGDGAAASSSSFLSSSGSFPQGQKSATVTSATFTGPDGESNWQVAYSRYRAVLDSERMNDFAVSRKAEYIDPLSNAILPSVADAATCSSLVQFTRNCVIKNFEVMAPMVIKQSAYAFEMKPPLSILETAFDTFHHYHGSTSPAYMQNVLKKRDKHRLWAYRVLQDLSLFGDGLFSFDLASRTATGYIPIYFQRPSTHDVLVLTASPTSRQNSSQSNGFGFPNNSTTGAGSGGTSGRDSAAADIHTTSRTRPIEVEMVFAVRTMIYLPAPDESSPTSPTEAAAAAALGIPGGFPHPPRFYLRDCCDPATQPVAAGGTGGSRSGPYERCYVKANFQCFGALLENTTSGLVKPAVLQPCIEDWYATQKAVLAKTIEKDKQKKTGTPPPGRGARSGGATGSESELYDMLCALQRNLTKVLMEFAESHRKSNGPSVGGSCEVRTNPLDAFFGSSGNPNDSTSTTAASPIGQNSPSREGSGSNCLLCFKRPKASVFQPCRHTACCMECAQTLVNHAREGAFKCPVCRTRVEQVQEIYL